MSTQIGRPASLLAMCLAIIVVPAATAGVASGFGPRATRVGVTPTRAALSHLTIRSTATASPAVFFESLGVPSLPGAGNAAGGSLGQGLVPPDSGGGVIVTMGEPSFTVLGAGPTPWGSLPGGGWSAGATGPHPADGSGFRDLVVPVPAVPVPESIVLGTIGVGLAAALRRRVG